MNPRAAVLAALATAAAVGAAPGGGQELGAIEGRIVSAATGRPVPGALVAIDAGRRTLTDDDGRFRLDGVVPGPYRIAAVGPGCHVTGGEVDVPAGTAAAVAFALELPAASDPTVEGWDAERRRRSAAVRTLTAEDIRRRGYRSVVDAVRALAPEMVGGESARAGARQGVQGRSRSTLTGSIEPLVVVDGVRMPQRAADALSVIDPSTVRLLEVIKGTAGSWDYGTQGVNGVIRIETARGATHAPDTPPEACGFVFPL